MDNKVIAIFVAILLSSCATGSPTESGRAPAGALTETDASRETLPDGTVAFKVECIGLINSWQNCWERALALCPNGYTLLSQNSIPTDGTASVTPSAGMGVTKYAYVKCN